MFCGSGSTSYIPVECQPASYPGLPCPHFITQPWRQMHDCEISLGLGMKLFVPIKYLSGGGGDFCLLARRKLMQC